MTPTTCLNCNKELTDKFCAGCGQAADTHRITFKNFIFHDLLHGTFHIERGILFTAKEAMIRPGKASLDYISGKRKRYYNVFYLILITAGLTLFVRHFYNEIYYFLGGEPSPEKVYINEVSRKMDEIFAQKGKLIIFLFVPFAAFNSYILFIRKKLNLSEHAIISGMILLGMLLISLIGHLFFYVDLLIPFSDRFANITSLSIIAIIILYISYGYFNAFHTDYSKAALMLRTVLFFALICFEILLIFIIFFGFISDWKFGLFSLNPLG